MTDTPLLAFDILGFCAAHKISRSKYYDLKKDPKTAPRTFKVGNSDRISHESAAEWRQRMERLTASEEA